jgi:hypothetical protein
MTRDKGALRILHNDSMLDGGQSCDGSYLVYPDYKVSDLGKQCNVIESIPVNIAV